MFRRKVYRTGAVVLTLGSAVFAMSGCSYDLPSLTGDRDAESVVQPANAPAPAADQIQTGSIPAANTPGNLTVVQVKAGDSLYSIARTHNLDWRELAATNHLKAPYDISTGQTLMLPAKN